MKRHLSACVSILMVIGLFLVVFTFSRAGGNFIATYKNYAFFSFIAIQLLLMGVYLAGFSLNRPLGLNFNSIDALLFGWALYLLLSFLLHHSNPQIDTTLAFLLCVSSYFFLRIVLASARRGPPVNIMVCGLLITSSLQSFTGLLQFYGVVPSLNELFVITGTFENPAPFALFIAVCFPISLAARLFLKGKKGEMLRAIALVNMILAILVLPLTGIRTSWIAAVTGSLWILELKFDLLHRFSRFIENSVLRRWATWLCLATVLVACGLSLYKLKAESADSRLLVWRVSLDKFLKVPAFGVGYGNFKGLYCKWQADFFTRHHTILNCKYASGTPVYDFAGYVKMCYNDYLQTAVEQGLAGLGIFLCLTLILIRKSLNFLKKKQDILLIGTLGGLTSLLLSGLFSYPFYSLPTYYLFFVFVAIISATLSNAPVGSGYVNHRQYWRPVTGVVFLLLSIYVLAHTLISGGKYLQYKHARALVLQDRSREAQATYAAVFPDYKADPAYLLDYGICLMNNRLPDSAFSIFSLAARIDSDPRLYLLMGNILKEKNAYKASEAMYNIAHLILPSRIYPKYLLTLLYQRERDTASAIQMARDILRTSVRQDDQLGENIVLEMNDFLKKCNVQTNNYRNLIHYGQFPHPLFNH